jgi:glutamate-1-semialdehyde 2,1-aminomutase
MAAGIATVGYLRDHRADVYARLEKLSAAVADGVASAATTAGINLTTNRVGAMWTWFFTSGPVTNYEQAAHSDIKLFAAFHQAMLAAGVWLPPSQFEAAFISTAHTDADIQQTVDAASQVFASIASQ